ncbi:hypothetical protein Q3G72_032204 [Acer saccharum]|nr:hypothetical protein Q3G72_032204 [Acer saccharum]
MAYLSNGKRIPEFLIVHLPGQSSERLVIPDSFVTSCYDDHDHDSDNNDDSNDSDYIDEEEENSTKEEAIKKSRAWKQSGGSIGGSKTRAAVNVEGDSKRIKVEGGSKRIDVVNIEEEEEESTIRKGRVRKQSGGNNGGSKKWTAVKELKKKKKKKKKKVETGKTVMKTMEYLGKCLQIRLEEALQELVPKGTYCLYHRK